MRGFLGTEESRLKEYLSRYDSTSVPDYFFHAWRILYQKASYSNRKGILDLAIKDMQEELDSRPQARFNQNRRQMNGIENLKFNWDGK